MKNIVIPSDFSLHSLDCIPTLLERYKNERFTILVLHVFCMSDSITDLLLLSRRNKDDEYISAAFRNRCRQLEWEYGDQIQSIEVKCFYGSTMAVLKNFLDGNHIDLIVYPEKYAFKKLNKFSFDPAQLLAKCGREVLIIRAENPQPEPKRIVWVENMSYSLSPN